MLFAPESSNDERAGVFQFMPSRRLAGDHAPPFTINCTPVTPALSEALPAAASPVKGLPFAGFRITFTGREMSLKFAVNVRFDAITKESFVDVDAAPPVQFTNA